MIYQAICFDPLTSAVLSCADNHSMVDEMLRVQDYLPPFKNLK